VIPKAAILAAAAPFTAPPANTQGPGTSARADAAIRQAGGPTQRLERTLSSEISQKEAMRLEGPSRQREHR